jgi:UDP-N-acetylmuramate--alanine ligase
LITDHLADTARPSAQEEVHFVPSWSDVAPLVVEIARPGDLVLTVGAGDVTMIGPEILRLLVAPPEAKPVPPEQGPV